MRCGRDGYKGFTLIELLVVMTIIAILISLILPTIWKMKRQAKITEARSDVRQIVIAWNQYLLDRRRFPDPAELEITEMGPDALAILRGDDSATNWNPWKQVYMDFRGATLYFCDPWGVPGTSTGVYHVALDTDLDGRVEYPGPAGNVFMPLHSIAWSDGPDMKNSTEDDVGSWTEGK